MSRLNQVTNYDHILGVALEIDLPDFLRLVEAALDECGDYSKDDPADAERYYIASETVRMLKERYK